ncbi:hypothetical protein [Stutzerimonas nitrititolerans]|uniref:hypothetical protein n=1 Tax=Stutzerimonas nitrititolerans TaxID=2482751 RepID=UPI0028A0BE81|nr:hypothetical protein [Stutzerimonas nitrititolerans]
MIGTIVSPACDQAQYVGAEISQRHKIAKKQGIYFNALPGTHDIAPQARKQRVRQQMEVPGRCLSRCPWMVAPPSASHYMLCFKVVILTGDDYAS